jgi:ferrochelatase
MSAPVGVLVMAHGTPRTVREIAPFYTRIRRGRPPTEEQLAELEARYAAIGGVSPLTERTVAQVDALRAELEARRPGRYDVRYGAKHVEPTIEEGAAALLERGVGRVIGLVLTPHGSSLGSEEYLARARAVVEPAHDFDAVPPWYGQPAFVDAMATRVDAAVQRAGGQGRVVFSAHSLPQRVVGSGDTYPTQLEESALLVATAAGVTDWSVAWQSAGRTPEPWLGPDVRDVIRTVGSDGTTPALVVCPIGFVADHLEILYDLDIEAAAVASEVGLPFSRTESLNDDPGFISALADAVQATDGPA